MTVNPTSATTENGTTGEAARDPGPASGDRPRGGLAVPAMYFEAAPTRPYERLWLSAVELRLVADEVGATVVVLADLPVGLADIVKTRRRRFAASFARRIGQPR